MKQIPIIQCHQCYRWLEFAPEDVIERRWDQRYDVNCPAPCNTLIHLPQMVFRTMGYNKIQEEEAPPPPVAKPEGKPVVDKQQRAIDTALAVKKAGSKNQAAKVLGVSPQTVNNYLKWLPADYGTEQ